MSTTKRVIISKKNPYHVEKHRYYELKHFCLQYPTWVKEYRNLDGFRKNTIDLANVSYSGEHGDPTVRCVLARQRYAEKIELVERVAKDVDDEFGDYIFKAVTQDLSYAYLQTRLGIPCSRSAYYKLYRKFFWMLSNAQN